MSTHLPSLFGALALVGASSGAFGVVVPFTESFAADASGWRDNVNAPLAYAATGAADGSGFATANQSFANSAGNDPLVLLRGQSNFTPPSSGSALYGDWITAGVTQVRVDFRHNLPSAAEFFARVSTGAASMAVQNGQTVQPNTWTTLTFDISPTNPLITPEGPFTFAGVFGSIQRLQFGMFVPTPLAGTAPTYQFSIDNVRLVPAPGATALLGLAGLGAARRRRR